MRTFNFKARNIGQEKYLTYTMGEECELDEDVLDYCEENEPKELVGIIYEEDDDYDYLTYDITGKTSLEAFIAQEMSSDDVLFLLRNIANGMISLKEQAVQLSYILLNRNYIYINEENLEVQFICLPVESKAAVSAEFKSFVRQLLANMRYDVNEDLNYVGKLITYINSDSFNLRGLIGLSEALMEEAGMAFEEAGAIESDGVEVVNAEPEITEDTGNVSNFMSELSDQEEALPEIGEDDDEADEEDIAPAEEEELDSILPTGMAVESVDEDTSVKAVELEEEEVKAAEETPVPEIELPGSNPEAKQEPLVKPARQTTAKTLPDRPELKLDGGRESDVDLIKSRIRQLVGEVPAAKTTVEPGKTLNGIDELDQLLDHKPPVIKKNVVKVNRAALIQNAAEHEGETERLSTDSGTVPTIDGVGALSGIDVDNKPKSNSVLSKSVDEAPKAASILNAPKAMPYLIRVNTEERIMLGKVIFKIGKASRGVDYTVSGNGAISRQHAIITQKDGVCYIKDNKSTNHTYVNGKMLDEGIEEILTHDSMIRLGDEEFLFKIR